MSTGASKQAGSAQYNAGNTCRHNRLKDIKLN